jgi:hypothetical protein
MLYKVVDEYHIGINEKARLLTRGHMISSSVKRLGFRYPELDPNCQEKDSVVIVDGDNECHGNQLGNYLAALFMSIIRAKQRNNTFMFLCGNGSVSVFEKLNFELPLDFKVDKGIQDMCVSCITYAHSCKYGLNYASSLFKSFFRDLSAPNSLDDVTIHFRCGDILSLPFHEYGYPRYRAYNLLGNEFKTIGILSSPFGEIQSRSSDLFNAAKCKNVLNDYVDYFSSKYPYAKVSVRSNDSLEEAFGRLIYSNQSWCNPSTFCLFPVLATHGHGFILDSELYPFVRNIKSDKLTLVRAEMLHTKKILRKKMDVSRIIKWMRS